MFRYFFLLFSICAFALPVTQAAGLSKSETRFVYVDANGKVQSTEVISHFTGKMRYPLSAPRSEAGTCGDYRRRARPRALQIALLALCERGAARSGRGRFVSANFAGAAGGRRAGAPLRIQASAGERSVSGSDRLGSGLWVGPRRGPRGNSYGPRVRQRLPGSNTFAPSIDWRLRQDLVIVAAGRFLRSRIPRTGAGR